jgi:hypothetical protein
MGMICRNYALCMVTVCTMDGFTPRSREEYLTGPSRP